VPPLKLRVSQAAVAEVEGAGSGGLSETDSSCVGVPAPATTPRVTVATPLPLSPPAALTVTVSRTHAPAGGAWKLNAGAMLSWTTVASAGGDVSPSPPSAVAITSSVLRVLRARASWAPQAPVPPAITFTGP